MTESRVFISSMQTAIIAHQFTKIHLPRLLLGLSFGEGFSANYFQNASFLSDFVPNQCWAVLFMSVAYCSQQ
jgi:hypothetical protein